MSMHHTYVQIPMVAFSQPGQGCDGWGGLFCGGVLLRLYLAACVIEFWWAELAKDWQGWQRDWFTSGQPTVNR